ncbi:uncharacterized protein MELLADRAFT_87193 [Melampsora larici-populina 98AG31]|uniref:Uncharacterized protein n=1 Tax=Melampsora larici-populina (strain 98AG31 / pathotype 3-4-7) TaxID=747676 RepID=F4R4U9_MELLP|nr:uncharacterized protein MELLADRAFT_87193 [Melampsora larici-populina 98AG31]EGG12937.1 hypothetical protein MELLADRAFT_87193 [Melampsora larici-populina 98AG31]
MSEESINPSIAQHHQIIKRTSSHPDLRQLASNQSHHSLISTVSFLSNRNPSTSTSTSTSFPSTSSNISPEIEKVNSPLDIISIPTRSPPKYHQHHHIHHIQNPHHQRTLSVTSSIGSSSVYQQQQQHLLLQGRYHPHHRGSVSTCAMTDESPWDETDLDLEDAQGGINSLLMNSLEDHEGEGELEVEEIEVEEIEEESDGMMIDDDRSISSSQIRKGKMKEKIESSDSSMNHTIMSGDRLGTGNPDRDRSSRQTSMPIDHDTHRSTSTQVGAFGARMVRRKHVNRANLLPRPKAHLRVAAQLSTEDVSPDLLTEAEVHRRFRSVPFVIPPSSPAPNPLHSPLIPRTPSSPFGNPERKSIPLPPPPTNRFPEQVGPDDSLGKRDEESEDSSEGESTSMMDESTTEEQRMNLEIQKWKRFRGSGTTNTNHHPSLLTHPANPVGPNPLVISPGSPDPSPARPYGINGYHSFGGSPCSSLGTGTMTKPAKRRFQDTDRFDCSPNSNSFKRRAISPSASIAGSSSCVGSPILHYLQVQPTPTNNHQGQNSSITKD